MYIPRQFQEERIPVLHELIQQQSFASLVTLGPDGLIASHLPMVLDLTPEPFGTLRGHLSRANPQWQNFSEDVAALAIFSGPQHYVSPSWYPSKAETGKVVPTWNYVVVHAYGPLRIIEDAEWLQAHLAELTNKHEATFPQPWKTGDAPEDFLHALMNGIVGLELPIQRLEGKWKVSQNQPDKNRAGVVSSLQQIGTPESKTMAELVCEHPR